jgi:drug/metabolite transporter (DMT)-like permease
MSGAAFALVLGSAFMHASWNVLLAGARDSEAATAVATLFGCLLLLPVALAVGDVESAALPFAAGSAVLHLAYLALLARAYQSGEVSVVYPVSRGVAPVLVLVAGVVALGDGVPALAAAGVILVAAGVMFVGGSPAHGSRRDLLFGLAIAAVIASYTLVDSEGVDHAQAPSYLAILLTPSAIVYALVLAGNGRGAELRAAVGPRAVLTGALVVAAYACVLAALRLAEAAPVAAVRESSVVIAALMAAVFLGERVDARRLGGAVLVVAGVASIAYS